MGERKTCIPIVFCLAWPDEIKELFHKGDITNSDLEMAGLLMLWLVMEEVYLNLQAAHVAKFSNNSPTIGRVKNLAARVSLVAMQLVQALMLRLKNVRGITVDTFAHFWGRKFYDGYSITLFWQ